MIALPNLGPDLKAFADNFASKLEPRLIAELSCDLKLKPRECETLLTFDECGFRTAFGALAVSLDRTLTLMCIDILAGGRAVNLPTPHPVTEIESLLLAPVAEAAAAVVNELLPNTSHAPSASTFTVTFDCELPAHSGVLAVEFPQSSLEPEAQRPSAPPAALRRVPLHTSLHSERAKIALHRLLALEAGSWLSLHLPATTPLRILAEGASVAAATVCSRSGRKAAKLFSRWQAPAALLPAKSECQA